MPRVSGSYVALPNKGLSHTTRPARRWITRRASPRVSGSPVSHPSLNTITTVRRSTKRGQPATNSAMLAPIFVPPDQPVSDRASMSNAVR